MSVSTDGSMQRRVSPVPSSGSKGAAALRRCCASTAASRAGRREMSGDRPVRKGSRSSWLCGTKQHKGHSSVSAFPSPHCESYGQAGQPLLAALQHQAAKRALLFWRHPGAPP
jgi:hypothetical protein